MAKTTDAIDDMNAIANLSGCKITKLLYTGTHSLVYRGIRTGTRQPIVIKVLQTVHLSLQDIFRFCNQFAIAKNLDFPGVVKVFNLEEYQGKYALILEDFGGVSLSSYCQFLTYDNSSDQVLPLEDFFKIAFQLTEALQYLHQNQIIHNNIKPENILINPHTKQVKLIDFSASYWVPRKRQQNQDFNVLAGALAHSASVPINHLEQQTDYCGDFYALGITFHELLTKKSLSVSETSSELGQDDWGKLSSSVEIINADIPASLSKIVSKLIAKNFPDCYQSALEIEQDLKQCFNQCQHKDLKTISSPIIPSIPQQSRNSVEPLTVNSSRFSKCSDLATLLKATQAISGEIELDKLLTNLLTVVITYLKAERCVLLLNQGCDLKVAAWLEKGYSPQILPSIAVESGLEIPVSIINQVKQTLQIVVLTPSSENPQFVAEPYFQNHQPKSLLCSPILSKGQLVGLFYLEDCTTVDAFTSDRIEVLEFLCSQAAISLENGRLYQESRTYAQQLEQSLENLQLSEARYRYLATATSQIIWLANPQGENLNTVHWIAYTGQSEEEVKGTGWLNALHPDDIKSTTKVWLQAVETKSVYKTEYRIRGADGIYRYFAVQGVPLLAEDGSVKEWIGTCTDIDARRRAEDQLLQKSQQLEQTLQQFQAMQLQLIQNEKMSALGNLIAGVAHEINNPVGFLKGNIQPTLDYVNDLFRLIDLYQEKYPHDAEIQAEVETIELDYIREDLPKLVSSMQEGINRIQDISTSLRTFSRADSDRPVGYNIHKGLDSTIMILKHRLKPNSNRPEIEVIKEYGDLPEIECYAGQLNQVFMNLLSNAIDALEESNQGRVYSEIYNQIIIKTGLTNDKNLAVIQIQDNGIGMKEDVQQKIFDNLFTTKGVGKGTGLGLAIAKQIIEEKHQGQIVVYSTPEVGTKFTLTLPIKASSK